VQKSILVTCFARQGKENVKQKLCSKKALYEFSTLKFSRAKHERVLIFFAVISRGRLLSSLSTSLSSFA
jgi:hypothetical protein